MTHMTFAEPTVRGATLAGCLRRRFSAQARVPARTPLAGVEVVDVTNSSAESLRLRRGTGTPDVRRRARAGR